MAAGPTDTLTTSNLTLSASSQMNMPYLVTEVGVALAAVLGNSLVIVVFVRFRTLHTVTNYYIISLATADLLVGFIGIPCAIATSIGLPHNFRACLFTNSLLMLLCTSSILSLVAVTVDRYWAIIHPLEYPAVVTSRCALTIIAACWVLASVIGLLPVMGWNKGRPATPQCYFLQVGYRLFACLFVFILCPCKPPHRRATSYRSVYGGMACLFCVFYIPWFICLFCVFVCFLF